MRRLLVLLALSAVAVPARAQRSYAIKRFDAAILVDAHGAVDVRESITTRFTGAWNGIYRMVPVRYRTPQGLDWTLRLDFLGATDEEGHTLRVQRSRQGIYVKYKVWIPGASDATRTVLLHYRATNALRYFEDHDELYWNVTGDEWSVPVEAASARIELPPAATGARAIAFNGSYGSTARDAEVTVSGTTIAVALSKPLGLHEGLTAVVGWDKGAVAEPTLVEQSVGFMAGNWPLAIPVVVFLGMFVLWYRVGRDPAALPVTVQFEPPGGLTPAEAGTLVDGSVDMRDVTATLVNLAVEGRLKIREREESMALGLWKHTDYTFERLEPAAGSQPLVAHEQRVLDGIFAGHKDTVRLSDLEHTFCYALDGIRESVFKQLIARGLYRSRPDEIKGSCVAVGLFLGVVMGFVGVMSADQMDISPAAVIIAAASTALVVMLFGLVLPARTVAGARMFEQVRGFEEFLLRVESDRYARVVKTPEMFERFLPYAMAFGVEQKWARGFQDLYREPPKWYVGTGAMAFTATTFSHRLSTLSGRAGNAMGTSPRSQGGSGFSGGSSGGGVGGGGGGAF